MPAGRPFTYTDEQVEAWVCEAEEWLMQGKSLKSWTAQEGKPEWVTFWRWGLPNGRVPEMRNRLARARELGSWMMHDEIIEIADDSSGDSKTLYNKNGDAYEVCDTEFVQRSRVRIEARLKIMAINNATFREKTLVDHRHEGTVKVQAVQSEIIEAEPLQVTKVEDISDEDN